MNIYIISLILFGISQLGSFVTSLIVVDIIKKEYPTFKYKLHGPTFIQNVENVFRESQKISEKERKLLKAHIIFYYLAILFLLPFAITFVIYIIKLV